MSRIDPRHLFDADRVAGTLWQGGYPPLDGRIRQSVDAVVFCAEEYQPSPEKVRGVERIYAPNDDDFERMTEGQWRIATKAGARVRYLVDRGKRVLVTCAAGLNRSGLVSAISLMLPPTQGARVATTPSCLSSRDVAYVIRRARGPNALSNPQFVRALGRLDGRLCPGRRPTFAVVRA